MSNCVSHWLPSVQDIQTGMAATAISHNLQNPFFGGDILPVLNVLEDLNRGDGGEDKLHLTVDILGQLLGSPDGWRDISANHLQLETAILDKTLKVVKSAGDNNRRAARKSWSQSNFSNMLPFSGIHHTATTKLPSNLCK